jgi:uncharacterized protein (TIGR03067 family)
VAKTSIVTLVLVAGCLLGGCAAGGARSVDHERLQGIWLAESESQSGRTKPVSFRYVFSGDTLVFTDENAQEMTYAFKLESKGPLRLITIWPSESREEATPVSVAYELAGDSLTLVIAPPGLRPAEISDRNDQELILCRRKRP